MRARRAAPALAFVLLLAGALLLAWFAGRAAGRAGAPESAPASAPAAAPAAAAAPATRLAGRVEASGGPPRGARRRQLVDDVQRADRLYCNYLNGSRYPPGSRPMRENPDQNRPNDPVVSTLPMQLDDGAAAGAGAGRVLLQTAQSRIYLAPGETAVLSLRAIDGSGAVLPLVVTRAVAQGIVYGAARPAPQATIPFAADSGGAVRGLLDPAQSGLAGFAGTIRTEVRYSAGGNSGVALFDVIHAPDVPAVWAGPPREALEEGSLNYYLRLDVRQPGRYIVNGRVDDARGQPVALLTFNDVLGPGPRDVKLTLFGKLLRDGAPAQPLTLRDVDGWLLKENADPDRALLPRLEGAVLESRSYAVDAFTDAEWQSEERSRYLNEFARDLRAARARLAAFDPAAPAPPSACMTAAR